MENEAVIIRIRSLIWWSGYSAHQVSSAMAPIRQEQNQDDLKVVEELRVMLYPMEYDELENSLKSALGHIAGYLARSATRGSKCGFCADILVDKDSLEMTVSIEVDGLECEAMYRSFTELLDRGKKLLAPSTAALEVTLNICHIWRAVVKEENSRRKMFESSLPRNVFA